MEVSGQLQAPAAVLPDRKSPQCPLDRKVDGAHSRTKRRGVEKNLFLLPGIEPRSSSQQPIAIPTELPHLWLRLPSSLLYSGFKTKNFVRISFLLQVCYKSVPSESFPLSFWRRVDVIKLLITHFSQSCFYEIFRNNLLAIYSQQSRICFPPTVWEKVLGPYRPKHNRIIWLCEDNFIFGFLEMRPKVKMF
jgi:hypothetical protein